MGSFFRRVIPLFTVVAMLALPATAGAVAGFSGPVFGLGTSDGGAVLVADAGAGIRTLQGSVIQSTIPLPGVTAVSSASADVLWATTGAGDDPESDTGQAVHRIVNGVPTMVANLFEFEETNNPDGQDPFDSNPYDIQALGPENALVVDAGANALLELDSTGTGEVIAVFPDELVSTENIKTLAGCPGSGAPFCGFPDEMPAQAVPTSVAIGADGSYYVGELKGFPGPTGESNIWQIDPSASNTTCPSVDCVKLFDGSFTSIIDLAFHDGRLYVAEMDEQSWAAVEIFQGGVGGTISSCDVVTKACEILRTGIPMLTAITFDGNGTLWASRNTLVPGAAEVFAIHVSMPMMGLVDTSQGSWTLPTSAPAFFFGNLGTSR